VRDRETGPSAIHQGAHRNQAPERAGNLCERCHWIHRDARDDFGLAGVRRRNQQPAGAAPLPNGDSNAEDSRNRPNRSIQRQFADRHQALERGRRNLTGRREDPEGNREIEDRSLLAEVGRSKVHRDPPNRHLIPGMPHGRPNSFTRLPHSCIRQPHDRKHGNAWADINLHLHGRGLEPHHRRALHPSQHVRSPAPIIDGRMFRCLVNIDVRTSGGPASFTRRPPPGSGRKPHARRETGIRA